jgi:GAF domain
MAEWDGDPARPGRPLARIARSRKPLHVADLRKDRAYLDGHALAVTAVELGGVRTMLGVPMIKENKLIGAFFLYRQEVRPFTDKQIELVTNFAAQAVIAIENARLLNELRQRTDDSQRTTDLSEALEQQTATSEVLRVISSSPGDLKPVFETMLASAARICDAHIGGVYRWDGEFAQLVATTPALRLPLLRSSDILHSAPTQKASLVVQWCERPLFNSLTLQQMNSTPSNAIPSLSRTSNLED